MKPETRQKLVAMYKEHAKARIDGGLAFSLGDHLRQVRHYRQQASSLDQPVPAAHLRWANVVGVPLWYAQALTEAVSEGVSDQELNELNEVRVAREATAPRKS